MTVPFEGPVLTRLPAGAVTLLPGFWSRRKDVIAGAALDHALGELRRAGNLSYFEAAAAGDVSRLEVAPFADAAHDSSLFDVHRIFDSDVYKWLEVVAHHRPEHLTPATRAGADEVIGLVTRAQQTDGYLNTWVQLHCPDRRWVDWDLAFELYDGGHLISAATAWAVLRDDDRLLTVARRFADHVGQLVASRPEPIVPRHPGIESALVGLARVARETAYLDLAVEFVRRRGLVPPRQYVFTPEFYVDDAPVVGSTTIRGHAVMALYLLTGALDVAVAQHDGGLLDAVRAQWEDMVSTKTYVTGGVGARHYEEAFGDPYELPLDRSYQESCAAVASVELADRLFCATGDVRCADLVERTLYNAVLAGISLDGLTYFYDNPLHVRDVKGLAAGAGRSGRMPWFECACCPPNLMKALSSIEEHVAGLTDCGIQIDQFVSCRIDATTPSGSTVRLEVRTELPYGDGRVTVTVVAVPDESPWELALRVPEWGDVGHAAVRTGGREDPVTPDGRYLRVTRSWRPGDELTVSFSRSPRWLAANPMVTATRGQVALQSGPLLFCLESCDQPQWVTLDLVGVRPGAVGAGSAEIGGEPVPVLEADAEAGSTASWGDDLYRELSSVPAAETTPFRARFVPYFAWANRGHSAMRVWVPVQPTRQGEQ